MKILIAFTILFLLLSSKPAIAQHATVILIDLAKQDTGSNVIRPLTVVGDEESVLVKICNRLPSKRYDVHVELETIPIPALPSLLSGFQSGGEKKEFVGVPLKNCKDYCDSIMKKIESALDEKALPKLKTEFLALGGQCEKVSLAYLYIADSITTYIPINSIVIRRGQQFTVTVTRKENSKEFKWILVYKTQGRGSWRFSYGFSFPLLLLTKEEKYFLRKNSDSTYIITAQNNSDKLKSIPSVYINWLPESDEDKDFSFSFAAGIGFDLKNPVVFLGGSVTYNQNLSFMIGGIMHYIEVLHGWYNPNQQLKENLAVEQLHEQKVVFNPGIALGFRFDSNPFH